MADYIESLRWTINKPVGFHCLFYAALIVKSNHNQNWGYSNSTDGLRHSATLPGRINLDDDVAKLEKSAGHLHLKGSIKIKSLEGKRRGRRSQPNQKKSNAENVKWKNKYSKQERVSGAKQDSWRRRRKWKFTLASFWNNTGIASEASNCTNTFKYWIVCINCTLT